MSITLVACKTLQDEIEEIISRQQMHLPIEWIPSGLHNTPARLTECLQQTLDCLPPTDTVLLAMGYCGNSLAGIRCGQFRMIVPRKDDCISLLLGPEGNHTLSHKGVYFMTAGWLRGERNLMTEYHYTVEKFGEKRGKKIFDAMFRNFSDVALLDTGCYDLQNARAETKAAAEQFSMRYTEIAGNLSLLEMLLTGPWPEEHFLTIAPGQTITSKMLTY